MTTPYYEDATVQLHHGDCLDVLRSLPDNSVDSVVTDPPYGLEFMGREWDSHETPAGFQAWCLLWATECLRVLKPGGHILAFGGTRTWHRLACAVEDAGFEVRDSVAWLHGQGFPKNLNVSKALDDRRCRCAVGEWPYGTGDAATEHGLRDVPSDDVSQAEGTPRGSGPLLLPSVSEQSPPPAGRPELRTPTDGGGQPGMEGRGHAQAPEGELRGSALHTLPAGVPGDGAGGRLHHGASASDGPVGRALSAPVGSGEPQGSQPVEQLPVESGAVSQQRGSQAWGGWPVCERCSQPAIPDGLGTAAKPAFEPVVVARKPLSGTVASNVLAWGTGALNVDGCRIDMGSEYDSAKRQRQQRSDGDVQFASAGLVGTDIPTYNPAGRWPANVVLDESQAAELDQQSGVLTSGANPARRGADGDRTAYGDFAGQEDANPQRGVDIGGASRFMYVAKAGADERVRVAGIAHPTVKPLALMRWLVRLVTPPGGTVLEPFAGSGTTVEACILEGFHCLAIEREADYLPLIVQRINRRRDPVAAVIAQGDDAGLFDLLAVERRDPDPDPRAGEATAEKRYTSEGGTNFAMKPGRRYKDGGR